MDRLTERTADGILVKEGYDEGALKTLYSCFGAEPTPHYANCDEGYCAMEKLAILEDLAEQGRLLELPCAVGDTVWYYRKEFDPLEEAPFKGEVRRYEITSSNTVSMIIVPIASFGMSYGISAEKILDIEDFGKTVFLTQEEAETALQKLNGESS